MPPPPPYPTLPIAYVVNELFEGCFEWVERKDEVMIAENTG